MGESEFAPSSTAVGDSPIHGVSSFKLPKNPPPHFAQSDPSAPVPLPVCPSLNPIIGTGTLSVPRRVSPTVAALRFGDGVPSKKRRQTLDRHLSGGRRTDML
ncbi:hypothetical protein NHX12_026285 [Muraenolepis orangiensis]|uniref:Uncharacterized protein n=1 Tax=Muraenolepis orangiensis TaxID=630683 RepID=A0A9Q0EJA4_9TELE|nr:hypothetical protein NHX12_026285 [Muraenolepis orangiensis]